MPLDSGFDSFLFRNLDPGWAVARSEKIGATTVPHFTPERYETCPVLFFRHRFARTCSPCSPPPNCCRPPRTVSPLARRSTRRSTTRPTSSPRPRSTTAPATSTICSTVSVTACRCCRPPTPASPRCRNWSTAPSRSAIRCCRRPSVTRPSRRSPPPPSVVLPPATCAVRVRRPMLLRRRAPLS